MARSLIGATGGRLWAKTMRRGRVRLQPQAMLSWTPKDYERDRRTELHIAAGQGDADLVQRLIEAGADVNAQDRFGFTPLHLAAQERRHGAVALLLEAGAKPDLRNKHGNTPLVTAVFNSRGEGDSIAALRAAGADPHAENNSGVSPLSLARTIGNYDVAQFFADLPE